MRDSKLHGRRYYFRFHSSRFQLRWRVFFQKGEVAPGTAEPFQEEVTNCLCNCCLSLSTLYSQSLGKTCYNNDSSYLEKKFYYKSLCVKRYPLALCPPVMSIALCTLPYRICPVLVGVHTNSLTWRMRNIFVASQETTSWNLTSVKHTKCCSNSTLCAS